jgi:hypothetical protein
VVALGAAIALAACGGKSDEQKVRDVVDGFDKTLFTTSSARRLGRGWGNARGCQGHGGGCRRKRNGSPPERDLLHDVRVPA